MLEQEPSVLQRSFEVILPSLPSSAITLQLVLIPAGTFLLGSPESEKDRHSDEGPQHSVTISQPFYMGKYTITQAQWLALMGYNPASFSDKPNHPVEQVSWNESQIFIEKLNRLKQGFFRLPTEAEWEYACRAGTTTRYYWGDDLDNSKIKDYAWYDGNNRPNGTKEVGLKLPNAWGLYDMCGNVWEWCRDWYDHYSNDAQIDPTGPSYGEYRVLRGCIWFNYARDCRSAFRYRHLPDINVIDSGLRVVRVMD